MKFGGIYCWKQTKVNLTGLIRYEYGRAVGMVGLIRRCPLWQHSQQTAPIRLPGKCTSDLAGWKHSHRWGMCKSQICAPHPGAHMIGFPVHPTGVALLWEQLCSLMGWCIEIPKPAHLGMATRHCPGELDIPNFYGKAPVETWVRVPCSWSAHI